MEINHVLIDHAIAFIVFVHNVMLERDVMREHVAHFKNSTSLILLYLFQNNWDFNSSFILPCGVIGMVEIAVGLSIKGEGSRWFQVNKTFTVNEIITLLNR